MAIRRSYTQSRFNFEFSHVYCLQIFVVAMIVGVKCDSLSVSIATVLGLFFLSMIPVVGIIIGLIFACVWAMVGYQLGSAFGDLPVMIFGGLSMFIVGFGFSVSGLAFINDMSGPWR